MPKHDYSHEPGHVYSHAEPQEHEHSFVFRQGHSHPHDHDHGEHGHTHGVLNPVILTTKRGIWAVKWSFIGLMVTTVFQAGIVVLSGSVALLADTIHNLGDACTAIPLGLAFMLARRKPSQRFTYGYGRMEDLAGVAVVLTILASAIVAGYESIQRFSHPQTVSHLGALVIAALVGFFGNEAVAIFRIRVGKEIGSAALVADGYHARTDGLSSLCVLFSALGVWLGYPLADPIIGLLMTALILKIVWESGQSVFTRLLDGVDPEVVEQIAAAARQTPGVENVSGVRVRWLGHRLHAELNIAVRGDASVREGHALALQARHQLLHQLPFLTGVVIHVDPPNESGDEHHQVLEHAHDGLFPHSHV